MSGDDLAGVPVSAAAATMECCPNQGVARGCDPFFSIHIPKLQSRIPRVEKKTLIEWPMGRRTPYAAEIHLLMVWDFVLLAPKG